MGQLRQGKAKKTEKESKKKYNKLSYFPDQRILPRQCCPTPSHPNRHTCAHACNLTPNYFYACCSCNTVSFPIGFFQGWQKRYFVLDSHGVLSYFRTKDEMNGGCRGAGQPNTTLLCPPSGVRLWLVWRRAGGGGGVRLVLVLV